MLGESPCPVPDAPVGEQQSSAPLPTGSDALERLARAIEVLADAIYLLAETQSLSGDQEESASDVPPHL